MAIYEHERLCEVFYTFRFLDEDGTMVEYSLTDEEGLILDLHIWPYDEYALLLLWRPNRKSCLFHVEINSLEKIIYQDGSLNIFKEENKNKPSVKLIVKPYISLACIAEAPKDKL